MIDTIRPMFHRLRQETGLPGALQNHVLHGSSDAPEKKERWRVDLIGSNRYTVVFHGDYCGASCSCLEPRDGEAWIRGNDLSDGELTEQTLDKIIADVVNVEETGQRAGR